MGTDDEFTITKKISKMGENNIIVIPKALKNKLSSGDLVEMRLKVLEKGDAKKSTKAKPKKKAKDDKLDSLIGALVDKGYSYENIEKVLVENGYDKKDVKESIATYKRR